MSAPRRRFISAAAMVLVMAAGLLWRSPWVPLPVFARKYGGDALWALLAFVGIGFLAPRQSTVRTALAALVFAWAIEFSQLYHAPWIDAVRATRLGGLILGSTFNAPDLLAYAVGIAVGAWVERRWRS